MKFRIAAALAMLATAPAYAEKPRLIIAISVDQLSSNLFEHYRPTFIGGLKTLSGGVAFASGYQSHAATETCPGHSTILSGIHPARSGIMGNDWYGTRGTPPVADSWRDEIYCVEDESNPASSAGKPVVSLGHVTADFQTLGDRLKSERGKKARVFAVAGKDRAATLMAGRSADQTWWYDANQGKYVTYIAHVPAYGNVPTTQPAAIAKANDDIATLLKSPPAPLTLSAECAALVKPMLISGNAVVGAGAIIPNADAKDFRATPAMDGETLAIAAGLISEYALGKKGSTDVLAISLSATDYVGHAYGPGGPEMCAQMASLDEQLGTFLKAVDATGVPYAIVLTADHGGIDIPERSHGTPGEATGRSALGLGTGGLNSVVRSMLGIKDSSVTLVTSKGGFGDVWLTDNVPVVKRPFVTGFLKGAISGMYGVETVFTRDEIMATPMPSGAPDKWSLIERVRASYRDGRSGHLYIVLKDGLSPLSVGARGIVATHGSVWDYDRRVPMLFWWKGITPSNRPEAVDTVDILPTLASLVGLKVQPASVDGRCLDLTGGKKGNCR